jgi:hypothetical protein
VCPAGLQNHEEQKLEGDFSEMRRSLLTSIMFATLVPAASVWAAPDAVTPSNQYLSQINEQSYQIQVQADRLESYLRSGAHDWGNAAGYTNDMADSAQKLASLLDRYVAQPGITNDTRQQVDKMKIAVAELRTFVGNTFQNLDVRAMPLYLDGVFANTANIVDRGNLIRSAAQSLAGAN